MFAPPFDSKIMIEYVQGDPVIVVPQRKGGAFRYLTGIFVLFWLGAWAMGWVFGLKEMVSGTEMGGARLFLLCWLVMWTIGGGAAVFYLYRMFRPAVPERITLSGSELAYDSGIAPLQVSYTFGAQRDAWKRMFQKRVRTSFDLSELQTLKLRDVESGNRLTVDQGTRRFDLAAGVSEPEKEWLYGVLRAHYRL